jgi:hypothetical protein
LVSIRREKLQNYSEVLSRVQLLVKDSKRPASINIITRILVTGTEGYLGSLLAPELIRQAYEVIGLDTGFYKERTFYQDGGTTPLTLAKDLRYIQVEDLKGVDAVVHMAELSNDPAGQLAARCSNLNHSRRGHRLRRPRHRTTGSQTPSSRKSSQDRRSRRLSISGG